MDTSVFEQRLHEELAALALAGKEGKSERAPVALDQQSTGRLTRMDALQQQSMAVATQARRVARMGALQAALDRITAGEFGDCVRCGEEISEKRLQLDPTLTTCITCAGAKA